MRGLMLKEIYTMKHMYKSWALAFLFVAVYSAAFKNIGLVYMFPVMFGFNGIVTSFSSDEASQWDVSVLAMPVNRKKVVQSKYAFMLFMDFLMTAAATAVVFLGCGLGFGFLREMLLTGGALVSILMIYQAIEIPVIFRVGVEKARLLCLVMALTPLLCLAIPWVKFPVGITVSDLMRWEIGAFFAAAAALAVSYHLSVKIYARKAF